MEQHPHTPGGEDHPSVNSYGTDDPERQAHIEQARIDAANERKRNRQQLERLVDLGMAPDDAEAVIEFEASVREQRDANKAAGAAPDEDASAEREPRDYHPRIYVADLASQRRGIQHGLWLDATQETSELTADIVALLESSPTVDATAWAVQATEDFGGLDLHGFTDIPLISRLAQGIAEHGTAYAVWVSIVGTSDTDLLEQFEDFYLGNYDSPEAWARATGEELDWDTQLDRTVDPGLRPYVTIDYAKYAREAQYNWDVLQGIDGRTYVFLR
jgi:antirestriction protein